METDNKVELFNHGYVQLIPKGCWGSDEIIIESARMSTGKGFVDWEDQLYSCSCHSPDDCSKCHGKASYTVRGDKHLLRYLWENKHYTPFEMAGLTFEIQAPIIVFREWHRHRTQSYNEMSGRYTVLPDLYYIPYIPRLMNAKQSSSNKQSSHGGIEEAVAIHCQDQIMAIQKQCREVYQSLLDQGIARELARIVLPVSQYSRMRASANLRNWMAFLTLRTATDAQWEIRQYAEVVSIFIRQQFPRTWELWNKETNE